jgi:hypothetical protein
MATNSEMLLKILDTIRDSLFVYGKDDSKMSSAEKEIALKTCEDFADFLIEVLDLRVVNAGDDTFTIEGKIQNPEEIF